MTRPIFLLPLVGLVLLLHAALASAQLLPAAGGSDQNYPMRAELNATALQPGQQAVLAIELDLPQGLHSQSATPLDDFAIPFSVQNVTVTAGDVAVAEAFAPVYAPAVIHDFGKPLGKLSIFEGRVLTYVPIQVLPDAPPGEVTIRVAVTYQVCNDEFCFPPVFDRPIEVTTRIVSPGEGVSPANADLFENFDPKIWAELAPQQSTRADTDVAPAGKSFDLWGVQITPDQLLIPMLAAFVVGIFFNVVPCVLPVLPIKAMGFFEAAKHDRAKCMMLGIVFSLGIIATFAALGVIVFGFKAIGWGEQFSNPWFAGPLVIVLLAMAVGMFGVFGVGLPGWVWNITPRHDTYSGNFGFGILTAVLSTPCTFGLFVGLMGWAAEQPSWLSVLMLMIVGAGMAMPYLILSAFPQLARNFPRTGPWAEVVKHAMGFWLIAIAAYFAQSLPFYPHVLSGDNFWWLAFALIAASFMYVIVRTLPMTITPQMRATITLLCLLLTAGTFVICNRLANPPFAWTYFSDTEFASALATGRPVLLKFTASWCGNCHAIEATVYRDEQTVTLLDEYDVLPIKVDLTSSSAQGWPLLNKLQPVGSIPLTAVYMPGEDEPRTLSGIYSRGDLERVLSTKVARR